MMSFTIIIALMIVSGITISTPCGIRAYGETQLRAQKLWHILAVYISAVTNKGSAAYRETGP